MTGALPEPKVSSEKTITKNIAYADKLIQIGSGAGRINSCNSIVCAGLGSSAMVERGESVMVKRYGNLSLEVLTL